MRSKGARAGLLVLGCSMVGHVGNYLFYVLAARALSPAGFADLSAMTALATITFMPATGIQAAVARDTASLLAAGRDDEADGLTRWLARRVGAFQLCLLAVLALATPVAVTALSLATGSVWLAGIVWLTLGLGLQIGMGPLQGRERFGAVGGVLAGPMGALRPLLLLPGVAVAGVPGALGALVVATVIGLVLMGWGLRSSFARGSRNTATPLKGALPAVAALTAFASLTNADVLTAKTVLSSVDAGLYASAALLGKIALYAPSALALVLLPKVTARLEAGLDVRGPALLTMAATLATGVTVTLGILLAPSSLVSLVFGAEYSEAYRYAAPIAAVMTVASLLQVQLMMALASGERATIWLTVSAAVGQVIGLAVFASSAVQVILVSAIATTLAMVANEFLSRFGTIKLISRRRAPGTTSSAGQVATVSTPE